MDSSRQQRREATEKNAGRGREREPGSEGVERWEAKTFIGFFFSICLKPIKRFPPFCKRNSDILWQMGRERVRSVLSKIRIVRDFPSFPIDTFLSLLAKLRIKSEKVDA